MQIGLFEEISDKKEEEFKKKGKIDVPLGIELDSIQTQLDLWEVEYEYDAKKILAALRKRLLEFTGVIMVDNNDAT